MTAVRCANCSWVSPKMATRYVKMMVGCGMACENCGQVCLEEVKAVVKARKKRKKS